MKNKPKVIVFEEAHEVFNRYRQKRHSIGEPPLENLIRRLRKCGIGCFLVDQVPSLMPESAFGNLGTIISFPIKNQRCFYAVATATGLKREQVDLISELPQRTAVIQSQSPGIGKALLIRVPEITFPERPDTGKIAGEMRAILGKLPCRTNAQELKEAREKAQQAPKKADEKSVVSQETKDLLMPSPSGELTVKELKYLELWNRPENHFLALTFFDKKYKSELEISPGSGSSIRKKLQERGLIKVETIPTGNLGGQPQTLRISKKGAEFLKNRGVQIFKPKGRGSFQAKAWSAIICRYYEHQQQRCTTQIEGRLGGKSIDVLIKMSDGEVIAIEICISREWSTENLTRDSVAGADKIIFAAVKESDLKTIKGKIEKELGASELGRSMIEKAEYRLLREFLNQNSSKGGA